MVDTSLLEDVYIPIKPLFIISRIFGITPFSFAKIQKDKPIGIRYRHTDIICVSLWTIGYFSSGCYCVQSLIYYASQIPGKMSLLLIINAISMHATGIATLITSISLNRRKIPCMLLKLMNVDEMIEHYEIRNIYERTRLEIVREMVVLVLSGILIYLISYYTQCDGTLISIIHISMENCVITFNILITLLYADLIRILKYRYKYIIEDLEEYFKMKDTAESTDFKTQNDHYLSRVFYYKDLPLYSKRQSNSLGVSSESYKIHTLRYVYIQLYDSVMLLNSYFGIPILFEILTVMVTSVSALYGGVYYLRTSDGNIKTGILACYLIFFGFLFLINFAWLVICCHATSAEANRSMISIQRIAACSNVKHETSIELDKLSRQLDKMKVQFTACGFFSLNLPLLCTIIGGILTYILIAVQIT
jgi:hypothetical protein